VLDYRRDGGPVADICTTCRIRYAAYAGGLPCLGVEACCLRGLLTVGETTFRRKGEVPELCFHRRGARVVAVVGDAGKGGTTLDARGVTRLLIASQEVSASQFVLVTPSGSGGGGGFFGGLFGGGGGGAVGGSGSKPSKLEQVGI